MLTLNEYSIKNKKEEWEKAGIEIPKFDHAALSEYTKENPAWIHFGSGNIFRGFIAMIQQELLNSGRAEAGIIAAETYDYEIIDKIYAPSDNLGLLVVMHPDGKLEKKIIGSIAEGLAADPSREMDWKRLQVIFSQPSLQVASFTITEKGYNLYTSSGDFMTDVREDLSNGPKNAKSVMGKIASLAYVRYLSGELPIAFVSMDNCSHNGEKLYNAIETIVKIWTESNLVESGFSKYINDPKKVSFPWSMIDKITPRPAPDVQKALNDLGIDNIDVVRTKKNTFISTFVNTEPCQYLVIEDHFPNGHMPLNSTGVYFTTREIVERAEKMKVCTCLNPLHTSLAVFGCLLSYTLIADEMKDEALKRLVEKIGEEGMPVVVNPEIFDPKEFLKEVISIRLPNKYIPDTPQRIATDTSQKVAIRFGETIKSYSQDSKLDPANLQFIPLTIAGWCRYLMGIDDKGNKIELSSDPMLSQLSAYVSKISIDSENQPVEECLKPILSNDKIFGLDLYQIGLGKKIEGYFKEMIAGPGAVRKTLNKYLIER